MGGNAYGLPPKEATDPRSLARRAVFEKFHQLNPNIRVVNAGGLQLQGDDAESGFLMSMAGDTAPDVFYVNFREYYKFIDEKFCRPLDDLIASTPGSLQRVNPTILKVLRSYDGHIYAMPWFQVAMALYYRKDFFRAAGLDPSKPPRTWDEFYADTQKLTESKPGMYGFAFQSDPGDAAYWWIDFLWQAGGDAVVPTPSGVWKSAIASEAGVKALEFYRKLTKQTWIGPNHQVFGPSTAVSADVPGLRRDGKLAMWMDYTTDVTLNLSDLNPSLVGIAALPAGPAGRANEINAGMWAINSSVKDPKKLAACWKFIQYFSSDAAAKVNTDRFVDLGLGTLVNPTYLKKFGYTDILGQVDPLYVKANEEAFKTGHPEPYGRNCEQVYLVMGEALDRARLSTTPAMQILKEVAEAMNVKLLDYTPPDVLKRRREFAAGIFGFLVLASLVGMVLAFRLRKAAPAFVERLPAGIDRKKVNRFLFWCLLPAGASVLVWSYFPLARGLVIAFQDYHVVAPTTWVGFDNFINVFTNPLFYKSLLNTFIYVFLTISIGFFLPIILALMIEEIRYGKTFFRTVFYLPAMTSSLVIALLWRQFYDKTSTGLLNQLLAPVISLMNHWLGLHIATSHDWLGDPSLAMFAVVLPGVWAAAGPGSILYLAALKNVPQERYEAADIDGASWFTKIIRITLPGIKPLVLINLLGVFIGSFKAFDNIFVLTNGGPLNATRTIGLEVWSNAFLFLKFGYATAAAWVMGGILVGFTLIQVQSLLKMRFSAART